MVWLVWIVLIVVLSAVLILLVIWNKLERIERKLTHLSLTLRVRQSKIGFQKTNASAPKVDARARTTTRDTHDLPVTARQTIGVRRRKTNGLDNDYRLQQRSRAEAASVGGIPRQPAEEAIAEISGGEALNPEANSSSSTPTD